MSLDAIEQLELDETRSIIHTALAQPEMTALRSALATRGIDAPELIALVRSIAAGQYPQRTGAAFFAQLDDATRDLPEGCIERLALLQQCLSVLDSIPFLPVSTPVMRWFLADFRLFAQPDRRILSLFILGTNTFSAMCRESCLIRFPAGQLHWEISGLERRSFLRVTGRDRYRLAWWVALKLRGFGPAFFTHVNGYRRNRFVLLEEESNHSYFCLATSLELQPRIRGLVTMSWLHAVDVAAASPHLAWTNRTIVENGGAVFAAGPAELDSGVLENNARRKAQTLAGKYPPQLGLVLWPRAAMLAWAARNPQHATKTPVRAAHTGFVA